MTDVYDLCGRALLHASDGLPDGDRRALRSAMDPLAPAAAGADAAAPDVEIVAAGPAPAFEDVQGPANDGVTTARAGGALHLLGGGSACRLPDPLGDGPLAIGVHDGFALERIVRPVLRPALQLAIARRGAAAVHSAAVELDGGCVLVAGWSETGKTEGALAFVERGARFFSDKWTVCDPGGTATTFPIGVGVRRWVLPHLPRLREALPRRARSQMAVAASIDSASQPLRARARSGPAAIAAGAFGRAVQLADRAGLSPTEIRAAYGDSSDPQRRLPLKAVVLLRTVHGAQVKAAPVNPSWAAARLALSAAYERRPWFDLLERARFADPSHAALLEAQRGADPSATPSLATAAAWVDRERAVLERAFAGVPVIGVDVAFPADPNAIADAAMPHLS